MSQQSNLLTVSSVNTDSQHEHYGKPSRALNGRKQIGVVGDIPFYRVFRMKLLSSMMKQEQPESCK